MKHILKINQKPVRSGKESIPDGAICGNGDIGLILGNSDKGMRIYISKCDLWHGVESKSEGGQKPLGYIDIEIPNELYQNYYVEQDIDNGEVRCKFENKNKKIQINLRASKTENSIMLETESEEKISPVMKVF
ncbi:MAG: hypothetical protein KBT46_08685, partial [Ruminococcus sp.]|nr:hypothetical protein [Candidatus Copronaster equi]